MIQQLLKSLPKKNNVPTYTVMYLLCLFSACATVKTEKNNMNDGSSSSLLKGAEIHQDETFSAIKNNTARLKAMLSGMYVQYRKRPSETKYIPWLVNEGKDSVVIYSLPVQDFRKVGHWLYHYQIMTSLPNSPVYHAFSKMVEIDRDTIKAIYYEVPKDFKPSLDELLNAPEKAFSKINLDKLQLSVHGEYITYIRQNPVHFIGQSPIMSDPQNKEGYRQDFYDITPSGHKFQIIRYNKNKEKIKDGERKRSVETDVDDCLMKHAMMKADYVKKHKR